MSGMTAQSVGDIQHLVMDTISVGQELLNDIILQINDIDTMAAGKEYFLNLHLSRLSSDITNFVELTTLLSKILTTKKNITLPEIKTSHIHLLFILKGINQAQQKNDSLVLEDLIKHELKDNLTQWKIDLIPSIKRQLNP
jgi:hypothetical protein